MLLGAAFLLAVDTLCRTLAAIEVPPGVLTALLGTPFFLWLFAASQEELVRARMSRGTPSPSAFPDASSAATSSFTLADGEVMCVLGPNGGGKTTLFRTLLGLLPPHAGQVLLDGTPLAGLSRGEIARRIGYVPQGHSGYFAFTVRGVRAHGAHRAPRCFLLPRPRGSRGCRAGARLPRHRHLAAKPITEISGGERQLALVARALAQQPRLLVLDEPTASLDFGNQVRVLERISTLSGRGISILFSTHDPDHAFLCADRALLLGEGRVQAIGAPRDVIRSETLKRLYGVEVRILPLEGGGHACLPALRT